MMLIEHQIALTWRFVDIMQNVLQPQTRLPNPISHVMHDVCACVIAHTRSVGLRESGAGGGLSPRGRNKSKQRPCIRLRKTDRKPTLLRKADEQGGGFMGKLTMTRRAFAKLSAATAAVEPFIYAQH